MVKHVLIKLTGTSALKFTSDWHCYWSGLTGGICTSTVPVQIRNLMSIRWLKTLNSQRHVPVQCTQISRYEGDLWPVKSVVLDHLPEEGDDPLGAVGVHVRQVDLVTEHHQPHAQLQETMVIWWQFYKRQIKYLCIPFLEMENSHRHFRSISLSSTKSV